MPKEIKPGKPTTRRYTDSEKDQAVPVGAQAPRGAGHRSRNGAASASQLGYGVESVRTWVRERDVVDGVAGPDSLRVHELEQRNEELEQELRETRRANEILKKGGCRTNLDHRARVSRSSRIIEGCTTSWPPIATS